MKIRTRRLAGIGLAAAMMVTTAGCGGEDAMRAEIDPDTPMEEVTFPLEETAELSFITSAPATTTQEPNEKLIFQRLEEQTNVHIDWTCFVSDQFADKKNLALAQFGNLPDGLFNAGMSDYDLLRYAKQGIIIPLENLIDKYMPNLQAVFEKYPEYRTMCTAPDGHIYAFPWIEQLGEGKEAIQAIGDFTAATVGGLDRDPTNRELQGGIVAYGMTNMAAALFGGLPTATYSQNVGIVTTNKVVNRLVFALAGGFLLLAGVSPKFSAVLTTIPQCVLGGATITVFSTIAMTGMKLIASQKLNARNTTIVGLSAALGVGISQASSSLSQFPESITIIFGKSPVVIATLMAILLNLILPRESD